MVHVDLGKCELAAGGVVVGKLGENGGDGATGWTPVSVEVDYHTGGGGQEGIQLGFIGDLVNLARGFRDGGAVREQGL